MRDYCYRKEMVVLVLSSTWKMGDGFNGTADSFDYNAPDLACARISPNISYEHVIDTNNV